MNTSVQSKNIATLVGEQLLIKPLYFKETIYSGEPEISLGLVLAIGQTDRKRTYKTSSVNQKVNLTDQFKIGDRVVFPSIVKGTMTKAGDNFILAAEKVVALLRADQTMMPVRKSGRVFVRRNIDESKTKSGLIIPFGTKTKDQTTECFFYAGDNPYGLEEGDKVVIDNWNESYVEIQHRTNLLVSAPIKNLAYKI